MITSAIKKSFFAAWVMLLCVNLTYGGQLFTSEYASPVPTDYVIESAGAEGIVEGDVVKLSITTQVRVFRNDWVKIPLLSGKLSITSAQVEGKDKTNTFLKRDGDNYYLITQEKGHVKVSLTIACKISDVDGKRQVILPVIQSMAASTRLVIPAENVKFSIMPKVDAAKEELKEKQTAITLFGSSAKSITLTWSPQPRLEGLKPLVFVDHNAAVEIGRGGMRTNSSLRYSVLQGTVDFLKIKIPDNANLLNVIGEGISRWDLTPKEKRVYTYYKACQKDQRPIQVKVRTTEVKPKVTAEVKAMVIASRENLRTYNTINYDIREAGVFRFTAQIPQGFKLLDVRCNNLNTWQVKKDLLTVDLRTKAEGKFSLYVETEQPISAGKPVSYLPLQLLGVERETGHVAVSARKGTKVELANEPKGGAIQVDISELPQLLHPKGKAVELGFRYIKHPFELSLKTGAVLPEVHVTSASLMSIEERELRIDTYLDLDIRKSGIFELRLAFPKDLRLSDNIKGTDIEDYRIDEKNEELIITFQGKVTKNQKLLVKAEKTIDEVGKSIDFPEIYCKGVKKEVGYLALATKLAYRMSAPVGSYKGLNPVPVSEIPRQFMRGGINPALAFKFLRSNWKLKVSAREINPVINALVVSRVELSSTLETTTARVNYEIKQAGTDTFYFELPAGSKSVDINGNNIKERSQIDSYPESDKPEPEKPAAISVKPIIWKVVLQKKVKGTYSLVVTFERAMSDKSDSISYEGVRVLGVQREEGFIGMAARTNVEVTLNSIKNAYRIDVRQIPEWHLLHGETPAIWAFQYPQHPYKLVMDVTKHADVDLITAVAEVAWFETVVGRDGQSTTDLFMVVRNNNQQNLHFKLPEGAKIWEAKVNGKEVSLAKEKETGRTLIPIVGASGGGRPFQVTLRYEQQLGELGQWSGLDLQAPGLSIPIMRCLWDVYLPIEYDLVNTGGNMTRIEAGNEASIVSLYKQSRRQMHARAMQQRRRNNVTSHSRSLDTGAAATSGKVYYRFEKTMALDVKSEKDSNEIIAPVYLSVSIMRDAFSTVFTVILAILIIAGIVVMWKKDKKICLITFSVIALILFVIDMLDSEFYPDQVLVFFFASLLALFLTVIRLSLIYLIPAWNYLCEYNKKRNKEKEDRYNRRAERKIAKKQPIESKTDQALRDLEEEE